jgi:hypothetical protein
VDLSQVKKSQGRSTEIWITSFYAQDFQENAREKEHTTLISGADQRLLGLKVSNHPESLHR